MVWPDFCLGRQRASGPGMAARWAEDGWRSTCPGYHRAPEVQAGKEPRFEGNQSKAESLRLEMAREGQWPRNLGR